MLARAVMGGLLLAQAGWVLLELPDAKRPEPGWALELAAKLAEPGWPLLALLVLPAAKP